MRKMKDNEMDALLEEQLHLKNGEYSSYKERYLSSGNSLPLLAL